MVTRENLNDRLIELLDGATADTDLRDKAELIDLPAREGKRTFGYFEEERR